MILIAMVLILLMYALLSACVIYAGGKLAGWLGYDAKLVKKRIKFLWFAPVLIWLVWDLPTIPLHKYYCATQAGFFVYKTPEQWLKEHPEETRDELELLGSGKPNDILKDFHVRRSLKSDPSHTVTMINKRIYQTGYYERNFTTFFPVHRHRTVIADIENDEVLSEEVTFGSGYGNPIQNGDANGWKAWLANSTCTNSAYAPPSKKVNFISQIFTLRK